jgi:hypothetical protein
LPMKLTSSPMARNQKCRLDRMASDSTTKNRVFHCHFIGPLLITARLALCKG